MTKTGWFVVVIIIVVAAVALLWWNSASAPALDQGAATIVPSETTQTPVDTTGTTTTSTPPTGAPMTATVSYDGNSFSPSQVTIAMGGTVTFTDTSGKMWLASNPHPVHDGYDGTTRSTHCAAGYSGPAPFDECSGGSSFSFTFTKVGMWGYHDHMNTGAQGVVNVVAAQ